MPLDTLLARVAAVNATDGFTPLLEGLGVSSRTAPYAFTAHVYEPLVCLILQGAKEIHGGGLEVTIAPGHLILVSHDLPVNARVSVASPEAPYLSLVARLDLAELRSLADEVTPTEPGPAGIFTTVEASEGLIAVLERYVALVEAPEEARVLLPLVRRELHYRLLKSDRGGMLRQLLRTNSHASNISRAIHILRQDFRGRVEMEDLARSVGMSPSSFYKHFKTVTSTTPLQYQKDLRLTEAQRLLRAGEHSVSTAAFAVGYESPSQFSREYSRRFGRPPRGEMQT